MSVAASKWAKRQRVRTTCRVVLVALADFADKQGRCWPSQATLATDTGLKVRTVRGALAELTEAGLIARQHRGNGQGGRASDLIVLHLDREFDPSAATEAAPGPPELPATPACNGHGSYRQETVELPAGNCRVTGSRCRGKNLPRTTKNLYPSREPEPNSSLAPRARPAAAAAGPPPRTASRTPAWDHEYPFGRPALAARGAR